MSADNWTRCPKCKHLRAAYVAEQIRKLKDAYGKVPPADYIAMAEEANKPQPVDDTLREDYEIGIYDGGDFYVSYTGSCRECGFKFQYKYEEILKFN